MRAAAAENFLPLSLRDASTLAGALRGSLDWLCGRQEQPGAPAERHRLLDSEAIRRFRLDAGVSEAALRSAADCTLSAWRRLLNGRYEPTLDVVVALAGLLDRSCADLCR